MTNDAKRQRAEATYFEKAEHWISLVTLLFVAAYTVVNTFMWYESRHANAINRDNLIFSNRASVVLNGASWKIEPRGVNFVPLWLNSGTTQTVRMKTFLNWQLTGRLMPPGFSNHDYVKDVGTVALGGKSQTGATSFVVPPACIRAVQKGKLTSLYVWGRATYEDVFNSRKHITRFCWQISDLGIKATDIGGEAAVAYSYCAEGNCVDDDCENEDTRLPVSMPPIEDCPVDEPSTDQAVRAVEAPPALVRPK